MKTMFLVAVTALTLTAGIANAESEGGPNVNLPQTTSSVAAARNGQAVQISVTQSRGGAWLFAPQDGGGANN